MTQNLFEHNDKKSIYTSSRVPGEIIYIEECPSRIEDRKWEKYIRSSAGWRFIKKILKND